MGHLLQEPQSDPWHNMVTQVQLGKAVGSLSLMHFCVCVQGGEKNPEY